MKSLNIMREELARLNVAHKMPIEQRRRLVAIAKRAKRKGDNPRAELSKALWQMVNSKSESCNGSR